MCVFIHFIANHWPLKVVSSKGRVYTSDAMVHNSIKSAFRNQISFLISSTFKNYIMICVQYFFLLNQHIIAKLAEEEANEFPKRLLDQVLAMLS